MKKGLTYLSVFILFSALAFILSVALTWENTGIILSTGIYTSVFALQAVTLAFARRYVLKRIIIKQGAGYLVLPIGLFMAATMVVASLDHAAVAAILPLWTQYLGIAFIFTGFFIAISSLSAVPMHAAIRYSEQESEDSRGPYDVVRCPVELAAIIITLSIPLYFGSAYAFIPAGLTVALVITEAALKDHWRFVNYEYYYEYTKKVAYVLIPLIW